MKHFVTPLQVELDPSAVERAKAFAEAVINTVNYSDSNQFHLEKIQDDHFISKLGEEAVKKIFEGFGVHVKGPDYTIYEGKQKSWDSDLFLNGYGLAVKTQKTSSAIRYGLSWTFQSSGFRTDPILSNPEAYVCFVECDDCAKYQCTIYPPCQIQTLVFKEPKLPHLKGKKKVVYAEDLR